MQTRSIATLTHDNEQEYRKNSQRMLTRSQARELQQNLENRKRKKEVWFKDYIQKTLNAINYIDDEYFNEEDNIIEKTRIVDEMFYNINKYLKDFMEESIGFKKWQRFANAIVDKCVQFISEIYSSIHNNGIRSLDFTKEETDYFRQVIKNLKKTKRKYEKILQRVD